ncbi:MAG: nuclear transport factor 2 family protein [Deltaproteobacteria bacterium]|nr:nuclear transport factor 2 family protein [Deltaproteobacteria bacterium]
MTHPFAVAFTKAWSEPTPERLCALLHRDVVLLQPHRRPIRGSDAALADFHRLFGWLRGLHGEVDRVSGHGDVVFIEWRMRLPVGDEVVTIRAVDRFLLRDGLGIERAVYFDQLALVRAVLAHPTLIPGYVRYRCGAGAT